MIEETSQVPLHEKVFRLNAAIRKAGFTSHGRVRIDKATGKIIINVMMPVPFNSERLTVEQIRRAVQGKIENVCRTEHKDGKQSASLRNRLAGADSDCSGRQQMVG